jgi:hypothetical protein
VACSSSDLNRNCESLNTGQDFLDGKSVYYEVCTYAGQPNLKKQKCKDSPSHIEICDLIVMDSVLITDMS